MHLHKVISLLSVLLISCSTQSGLSDTTQALGQAAQKALDRKDYDTAITLFQKLLADNPDELEFGLKLGEALMKRGDVSLAKKVYEKLLPLDEECTVRNKLALCYVMMGQSKPAIMLYEEILKKCPGDAMAHNELAIAYDMHGQHTKALEHFQKALDTDPDNAMFLNNFALSLAFSGRPEEALKYIENIGLSPTATPKQRQNLATIYALLGRINDARKLLSKDLSPTQIDQNLKLLSQVRNMMTAKQENLFVPQNATPHRHSMPQTSSHHTHDLIDEQNVIMHQDEGPQ